MMICTNPECDAPAANKYCSRPCANKDKPRVRGLQAKYSDASERIEVLRGGGVSTALEEATVAALGGYDNAVQMLREMELQRTDTEFRMSNYPLPHHLETRAPLGPMSGGGVAVPRPLLKPSTSIEVEPFAPMYRYDAKHLSEMRRSTLVPYEDIERMQRSAPCVLASRMKKAPLVSAVTGERKWSIKSSDRKLAAVVTANARQVFVRNINDMLQAMDYGASFGSIVWGHFTADEIGVEDKGVGKGSKWYVVDKIQWAHPSTVPQILRDEDYRFAGYQHIRRHKDPSVITIAPGQALVLTYGGLWGNLYGQSMYEPVYDDWFWYEVILRDFLRYLQRMGVPVAVCYAPNRQTVIRPDGSVVNSMEYALLIAAYAASHSGLAIPSDVDPATGKPLWRLEYLPTDQRGEQFIKALQYFATQISRGIIVGDRAATQDSEVGSYGAAQIHDKNTQIDNDQIFKMFLAQFDAYWMKRYGQYNRDFNSPPLLSVVAEVLDPLERDALMKLFATAGNIKVGDGTPLDRIDWDKALRGIHAPVLTDEEMEEQRKKLMDDKLESQKAFQEIQPKTEQIPAKQPRAAENKEKANENLKARLSIIDHLADGGTVPVLLTLDDVRDIVGANGGETVNLQRRGGGRKGSRKRDTSPKDPEFEEKHKRDASGKFAKKEEEGDEEDVADDRDKLDQEPWPGAFLWDAPNGRQIPIKGVVTLDGIEYTVVDGVSKDDLLAMHEANILSLERGSEFLGKPMQKVPVLLAPPEPKQWEGFAALVPHQFSGDEKDGMVYIDTGLIGKPVLETVLFHENLHAQPRDERPWTNVLEGGGGLYAEEAFNGIIALEYAERYNLPGPIGWEPAVSPMAKAAQERGWDKQRLYDYARAAHEVDGDSYKSLTEFLLLGTDVELKTYYDALDEWWPDWEDGNSALIEPYYREKYTRWAVTSWPAAEYGDWGK